LVRIVGNTQNRSFHSAKSNRRCCFSENLRRSRESQMIQSPE
jgi:hypothetical protein